MLLLRPARWLGSTISKPRYLSAVSAKTEHYDLCCIGSGPASIACAVDAANRGKKVAVIDKRRRVGGVCVHTGTIPSKTFREAILHFTRYRHRSFMVQPVHMGRVTIDDILYRVSRVVASEMNVIEEQLKRHGIDLIDGHARFSDQNGIVVEKEVTAAASSDADGAPDRMTRKIEADKIFIGVGTSPAHRPDIPVDGKTIFDSDQILMGTIKEYPRRLIVVGAGVIGIEYASMINCLPGADVTVIDGRPEILGFIDKEIVQSLIYTMRQFGARFILGETVDKVEKRESGVVVHLGSGKKVYGDGLLYAVGRQANTAGLDLENVGVSADKRGLLKVNEHYQTETNNIYAAGDCIGFPALASTSMEQGRLASCHMWGASASELTGCASQLSQNNFPYGIYTIPEISVVGATEEELKAAKRPYEVGVANYAELAKVQMLGGNPGILKIIFDPQTKEILGVHAMGEGATEIIHIGQAAISMGANVEYFRDAVFNYPTLAEAYRVAAINGLGKC